METGQHDSEPTTATQKILREEDGSGSGVSLGVSREEVCTMGLSYALPFCPKSRVTRFLGDFLSWYFYCSILAACQNRSYFSKSGTSPHDIGLKSTDTVPKFGSITMETSWRFVTNEMNLFFQFLPFFFILLYEHE